MEVKDIISSGILELYAAGLTSEKESKEVEQWQCEYPEIGAELAAITGSIKTYAQSFARQPAPAVKESILSAIKKTDNNIIPLKNINIQNEAKIYGVPPYWRMAAAASLVLLIGSIAFSLIIYNKYAETGKQLSLTQQMLTVLEEKEKNIIEDMNVVQSKYSVPVALKGLEVAPDAVAKVFWMKNTGDVFIDASNLPAVPEGKQYQLWGIVNGKPVDGGMILSTKKGEQYFMQKMKSFGKAEAFAITLEPAKGNATPQGPMFVMGKM